MGRTSCSISEDLPDSWENIPAKCSFVGALSLEGINNNIAALIADNLAALIAESQRRQWQPTPVLLPRESQGRGSLVGCCLWGRTESDKTEAT